MLASSSLFTEPGGLAGAAGAARPAPAPHSAAGALEFADVMGRLGGLIRCAEADIEAARISQAKSSLQVAAAVVDQVLGRSPGQGGEVRRGGLTPRQQMRVRSFIEEHLDEPLYLDRLAEVAGLSASHLCRTFRITFGMPPQGYVQHRRVARAKTLMLTTRQSLAEIALSCGFADQAAMSKVFRRLTQETPAAWRRLRLS